MQTKPPGGENEWIDPDDAPELTQDWFDRAEIRHGDRVIRPGRPPLPAPKRQVTIRLDAALLDQMRATGPGWQTRINEAVREWLAKNAA